MTHAPPKIRLDQLIAERNLASSRSRARDMISRGRVQVDGKTIEKPGTLIAGSSTIKVDDPSARYVSRAAQKLITGLDAANIAVEGKNALDLGASTGGFTQVLLERGVNHVIAIDVGHGQMEPSVAEDPRVTNIEGCNARYLSADDLSYAPQIIVSDVSFISLKTAAEPALTICAAHANCVLLIKPQFEVGRDGIEKGGLVKDPSLITRVVDDIQDWFNGLPGWTVLKIVPSPITGGDGNQEFLLCGERNA